jgi:hypothetical protein
MDTFFQFNQKLTDLTLNAVQDYINTIISGYFTTNTGNFKQAFRRSNVLSLVDESSPAVLSSRSNVRLQQRFTPTAPTLISVINKLLSNPLTISATNLNKIVDFVVSQRYNDAANYMVLNDLSGENTTYIKSKLSAAKVSINQQLQFPVSIASPDDNEYIITSNEFTIQSQTCMLRNKLSSNIIQIVAIAGGAILVDNVGNYIAATGVVTINYFNPTSISAGLTFIKLAAVPSNQSALAPTRNEILNFDTDRSTTTAVTVSAIN